MFQDILVTGLVNGSAYALLAIGFSLIFGVARIVNIAHTAFYMLAAYCFYALMVKVGLGFVVSALVAVGAGTAPSVIGSPLGPGAGARRSAAGAAWSNRVRAYVLG